MNSEYKKYINSLKKTTKELKKLNLYKLDSDLLLLKKAFDIAYDNGIFKLYEFPIELQERLKFELFSKITIYSGNLSFLAIQILAANTIMNKNNFPRKEYFFKKKCGIAINHLRANKTFVSAKKVEGGYILNGVLTWASGYKIFNKLLIGFHFENKEYEVLSSFKESSTFKIIETPETFVGQGLNTVNVALKDFYVKNENIVSSNEIGNYNKNKSLSKTVHYSIYGLGLGAIKSLENEEFKEKSKIKLKKIKNSFLKANSGSELDNLRVELFKIVQDIITTGMILNGGKSILLEKNLQRYYRELIMFNSNGLNQTIKNLFLNSCFNKKRVRYKT